MPLIARIAMVFASGAIAGSFLTDFPVVLAVAACGALLLFMRERESALLAVIAIAGVALGALDSAADAARCPPIPDRAPLDVAGVLELTPTEANRTVTLSAEGLCRLRVRLPDSLVDFRMGAEVRVRGAWLTTRITPDGRASREGIVIASAVTHVAEPRPHRLLRARAAAQARIQELFPVAYPLTEALLVAQRENLNRQVREDFAASGLTHLLAISGTHVGLVAATLLLIARLLRLSRVIAALLSVGGAAAYVFLLGAPFAALRALIQLALVFVARGLQRPAHPLGLLAAAALVLTAIDPAAPLDAGFQLSFAGIFGIVLWRRPLIDLMPDSLPTILRDAIATTCAATAATTPIAAFHFGTVSAIAVIANLLAIPVVSLAVPAAAAALALSTISMEPARYVAGGSELTMLWLGSIAQKCARVPGGHFSMSQLAIISSTLAVVVAYVVMRERYRSSLRGRVIIATLAAALPLVALPILPWVDRSLEIHMIDVGQGDALAIRSPRGRWLLVDAGPASPRYDAGKSQVVPFLLQHHASGLAAAILTHPHLDHFGGLRAITDRMRVGAVIDPGMPVAGGEYDALLTDPNLHGLPWIAGRTGSTMEIDGVRIEFLAPDGVPLDASADANEYSAVFRLTYGRFSALFLGDLPAGRETRLVDRFRQRLDVDLLKVAHHGSGGSSSEELLLATSPAVALVPVGRRNRYRHPHPAALARLEWVGARVFRTDRDGTVSVSVLADGRMSVRTRQ
ncbi:MAG: DNA internalization-related competence protein ComEC/Rec2 [Gemmatimonadota bacterium]